MLQCRVVAILLLSFGVAPATTIFVHSIVYFDETGKAYSIDFTGGKISTRDVTFKKVDTIINGTKYQVPTASSASDHNVNDGDVILTEDDAAKSTSDLISFITDSKRRSLMQFFSDADTDATWADIGNVKTPAANAQRCRETDLSDVHLMRNFQGKDLDPKLDLSGDIGCVYVAFAGMPGADKAVGEDPIGYVFVSDTKPPPPPPPPPPPRLGNPEPSTLLLMGTGILFLLGAVCSKNAAARWKTM